MMMSDMECAEPSHDMPRTVRVRCHGMGVLQARHIEWSAEVEIARQNLQRGVARPLPTYWPRPSVPMADALALEESAAPELIAETEADEAAAWRQLAMPDTSIRLLQTPTKRKGKAVIEQQRKKREVANEQGELCKCGKVRAHAP
jgi:hypothetical protein